jgi:hypothetical protein
MAYLNQNMVLIINSISQPAERIVASPSCGQRQRHNVNVELQCPTNAAQQEAAYS